jgi:hypothetical protein
MTSVPADVKFKQQKNVGKFIASIKEATGDTLDGMANGSEDCRV